MSATAFPVPSSLRTWLTGLLTASLAFGACWTGAIMYWRSRAGDPGTVELMLYLFVLPGTLLAAALLARKRLADTAGATERTTAPRYQAVPATAHPPAALPLAILATAVRSPHGMSVEEIADTLASKQARPALDAELVDDDGFPLMTACCPDADDAALQADITAWLAANALPAQFTDEQWRALVLATGTTSELAGQAVKALPAPEGGAAMLRLALILPLDWRSAERDATGRWLLHTVAQNGWPLERSALVQADGDDIAAMLTQLATRTPGAPVTALLVACASHIGDATVQTWSASQTLFTPGRPHGRIPGEGAVGLLLADPAQAASSDGTLFAHMRPAGGTRRVISADAHRGAVQPALAELAQATLAAAQIREADMTTIVADTGWHTSRMLELMGYASSATPHLDNETDVIAFGRASGSCGAVAALTALALARH